MDWRLLAVASLAVLAGCGGFTGTGGQSPEPVTPAPVPTLPTEQTDSRDELAPGVTATGISDLESLTAAHARAAAESRYVWRATDERTYPVEDNGTVTLDETQTIVVENATTYRRQADTFRTRVNGRLRYVRFYDVYADGNHEYRSWFTAYGANRTVRRSDQFRGTSGYADYVATRLAAYLSLSNATVVRVDRDGGTYYRVIGTTETGPDGGPVQNYTARALIRSDGFVRTMDVRYAIEDGEDRIRVRYNYTYSEVGTATVTAPDWVADARDQFDRRAVPANRAPRTRSGVPAGSPVRSPRTDLSPWNALLASSPEGGTWTGASRSSWHSPSPRAVGG